MGIHTCVHTHVLLSHDSPARQEMAGVEGRTPACGRTVRALQQTLVQFYSAGTIHVLSTCGFNPFLRNLSNTRNLGLCSSCNHTDQGDLKQHRFCVTLRSVCSRVVSPSNASKSVVRHNICVCAFRFWSIWSNALLFLPLQ